MVPPLHPSLLFLLASFTVYWALAIAGFFFSPIMQVPTCPGLLHKQLALSEMFFLQTFPIWPTSTCLEWPSLTPVSNTTPKPFPLILLYCLSSNEHCLKWFGLVFILLSFLIILSSSSKKSELPEDGEPCCVPKV